MKHVQSFDGNEHGTIRFENVSFDILELMKIY